MMTTEAWVLHRGTAQDGAGGCAVADLRQERFPLPAMTDEDVLVEPLYGCWEGNMTHALQRDPIDICQQRGEDRVVIGNAGVVRVLKPGTAVTAYREGDCCLVFCNGIWDERGYPRKIFAYDAPGTVGLLARRLTLHQRQLIPVPMPSRYSLPQWAAFSLRFITAWANWKLAYGCWQLLMPDQAGPPWVWGWGGGVTLAELMLACYDGCQTAMLASDDDRLGLIHGLGIVAVDRRCFAGLQFDAERYESDPAFRKAYSASEKTFLDSVAAHTDGQGVSIFIDFIGAPVYRATLKALARPGVVTTAGWKEGMHLTTLRALECMNWHMHVHTHYARYEEGVAAVHFGEAQGWMPPDSEVYYGWDDIPQLARDHAAGHISSYYPLYAVNPL